MCNPPAIHFTCKHLFSISSPKFCAICVTTPAPTAPLKSHPSRLLSLFVCLSGQSLIPFRYAAFCCFSHFWELSRQFVLYTYTHTPIQQQQHTLTQSICYIYMYIYTFFYNCICVILNLIYLICNPRALSCVSMYKQNKKKENGKTNIFIIF